MISSQHFFALVYEYFAFLVAEFNFERGDANIRENLFYDQRFVDGGRVISISYENIEDYFQVIIYIKKNGQLPAYNDQKRRLSLNKLKLLIFPTIAQNEFELNSQTFERFELKGEFERILLKSAKELRLCLKHFPSNLI